MKKAYVLQDYGPDVQYVIDKVQALVEWAGEDATLFTAEDRRKLESVGVHYNSTEYWNSQWDYIPPAGAIIVYYDYKRYEDQYGVVHYVPGIKVGSGNAYLIDLSFLGKKEELDLLKHIADQEAHTTIEEKKFWSNKLNVDDEHEVVDETLVFNRD